MKRKLLATLGYTIHTDITVDAGHWAWAVRLPSGEYKGFDSYTAAENWAWHHTGPCYEEV